MHGCMCIFCGEYACIQTGVLSTMRVQMCTLNMCCDISVHICVHARCRVCICVHVCAVCSFSVGERGWEGSDILWGNFAWRGGLVWTEGEIGVFSVSSLVLTRVGVYVGVCVCIRTHTHTLHIWGTRLWAQGFGMRHLEGPKNPDGLNLGIYVFVYVYKISMCMYMLGGRMRSQAWTNWFFL